MKVSEPVTKEDFEKYFRLRYEILRKPWSQPMGSEKDLLENTAVHAMIKTDSGEVIACGRLQMNSPGEAQVRSMAVHPDYRGNNYGGLVLNYLEQKAKEKGAEKIILQAREKALSFYKRNGYELVEKTHLMFGEVQHYLMQKFLKP